MVLSISARTFKGRLTLNCTGKEQRSDCQDVDGERGKKDRRVEGGKLLKGRSEANIGV
jgi:hypothetical protein